MSFAFLFFFLALPVNSVGEELIELTRSLEGPGKAMGKLTVVSEPPGLAVFLDGSKIGQTPIFFLKAVNSGLHKVRIKGKETDVSIGPGQTLRVSLFKDSSFIKIRREKETVKQREPEAIKPFATQSKKPPLEERPRTSLPGSASSTRPLRLFEDPSIFRKCISIWPTVRLVSDVYKGMALFLDFAQRMQSTKLKLI